MAGLLWTATAVLLTLAANAARAAVNTATNSGDWEAAGTWSAGVPDAAHDVVIPTNITVTINGLDTKTINSLSITGVLTHAANTTSEAHKIVLEVETDVAIAAGGAIDVLGRGYDKNNGPGKGTTYGGGGHGGEGGRFSSAYSRGATYGSITAPTRLGSGGNYAVTAGYGRGGGAVRITAATLHIAGEIRADAPDSPSSNNTSGAGGSVFLTLGILTGDGIVSANGGQATRGNTDMGGGAGGRIAVVLTHANTFADVTFSAVGGAGAGNIADAGAAGTVYFKGQNDTDGRLIVDAGGLAATDALAATGAMTIFTNTTHRFDAITLTNYAQFGPSVDAVLDLSNNPSLAMDGGPADIRSKLVFGRPDASILWPTPTILTGTFSQFGTNAFAFANDVTLANGSVLTHEANATARSHVLNLEMTGNLTIENNAAVDVIGRGYILKNGPGAPGVNYAGGSHGGEGGRTSSTTGRGPTYGSITAPTALGSGGHLSSVAGGAVGGGAVGIKAETLHNAGEIRADALDSSGGNVTGGAGGSVFLTVGTLTGDGAVSANGGKATRGNTDMGGGGGGRIAVVLTNANAFADVTFSALGGARGGTGANTEHGAAGTVYLATQSHPQGELRVDHNLVTGARTLIGAAVSDGVVGDVLILNDGHLSVASGQSLLVHGIWSNAASFSAESGGLVRFAGATGTTNTVYGNTTFADLRCEIPGLTLNFEAGSSNAVTERITFTGDGSSNLTLRSTSPGTQWTLNVMATVASENRTFRYLDVQDSDARPSSSAISPLDSVNSGNNSNWVFAVVGQTNTWSGTTDTAWGNGDNWSLDRAPELFDARVVFPAGCPNYPILAGPVALTELAMDAGATLQLNGQTFTVNGAADIAGTLIASGSETVTFNSNLVFGVADAYTAAQSTLRLAGTEAQSFTPGGNAFHVLDIVNTNAVTVTDEFTAHDLTFPATTADVTLQGGFATTNLSLAMSDGARLTFAAEETYTVRNHLWLRGASGKPVILTGAGTWYLKAGVFTSVRYVEVTGSDASGGEIVYAFDSTGHGSNPNWDFATGRLWVGAGTDWTATANWSPQEAPGTSAHILIDGSAAGTPRLTAAATIGGLTVVGLAGSAALTVDMPFAGSDVLTVNGNVDVGDSGTLTHTANGATAQYTLAMSVNGILTVDPGGAIDVLGRGYSVNNGPGTGDAYGGGGHGGEGGWGHSTRNRGITYGSITAPTRLGSGGHYAVTAGYGRGGGAVRISAKSMHIAGEIRADAPDSPSNNNTGGAGGSVFLTVGTLTGDGIVSANGGQATRGNTDMGGGAGGRIAVALTNANTFADVTFSAVGGAGAGSGAEGGAAGTVYRQTAAQSAGCGTVIIDNNALATDSRTHIPAAIDPVLDELRHASVTVTSRGALAITASDRVASLTIQNDTERLDLGSEGTVLRIIGDMTFSGTRYRRHGLYTTNDWNGYTPVPNTVTGAGAIRIEPKGAVIQLR